MSVALETQRIITEQKKKPISDKTQIGFEMEAGGIEPPSRDISMKASTCVVNCLVLTDRNAY